MFIYINNTPDFFDSPRNVEKKIQNLLEHDQLKMVSSTIYRMRCADISAEDSPDGNWVIAKAMFSSAVTGTVTMVRRKLHHTV